MLAVLFILLAVKIFAFVSALMYSTESYRAANKLTKPAWCAILGLGGSLSAALRGAPQPDQPGVHDRRLRLSGRRPTCLGVADSPVSQNLGAALNGGSPVARLTAR